MAKSAGSLIVAVFVCMGVVWFWRDPSGFEMFLGEAINKGADLIVAVFDAISSEVKQRSGS